MFEPRKPGRPRKETQETQETQISQNKEAAFKRVYAKQAEVDHDLFKLEISKLVRNISYNQDVFIPEYIEHVHHFHSVDSRGRPQRFSNKVGGHFHEITFTEDNRAVCSKPLREVVKKRNGKIHREYVPFTNDDHTHEVNYKFSEKITPQEPNVEFVKYQSMTMAQESQAMSHVIPDVVDGE